jgi:hypothetical protein
LGALNAAATVLDLPAQTGPLPQALTQWTQAWAERQGH